MVDMIDWTSELRSMVIFHNGHAIVSSGFSPGLLSNMAWSVLNMPCIRKSSLYYFSRLQEGADELPVRRISKVAGIIGRSLPGLPNLIMLKGITISFEYWA